VLLWRTERGDCFTFKNNKRKRRPKRGKCDSLLALKRLKKLHEKKSERMRYGISKVAVKM